MHRETRALNERFQSDISVHPYLARDIDEDCREHIQRLGEVAVLFKDVAEVAAGRGTNVLDGKEPQLFLCAFNFVCCRF